MTPENTEQPQNNTGATHDSESDRDTSDADCNGVMSVDIFGLGGPEHNHREEVGA